ncbi:ProQ/FINO family protein [Oceanospirillum sanctuarii]|uniref:ProQ/FINO family protein n=1 Tax=Oceanospirillum sanctuarii TaxID=1434821 RepID=UPI0015932C34|nr:ProQ/FINO family protein [Oceanospirillum sanctuarii]
MPSDSSASTLDHLFNELSERADNSFQALKSHHQKIAELNQTCSGLKGENRNLQERCDHLERSLAESRAELEAAQEAALLAAVEQAAEEPEAPSVEEAISVVDDGLVEELQSENLRLSTELESLQGEHQTLEQRMADLQQRLKALIDGSLLDSSEAIRSLIRETLDPADWPAAEAATGAVSTRVTEAEEESTPDKFDAKSILAGWSERYPKAFSTVTIQPLKIGIHEDLAQSESLPDHWIRRALAGYVRSPRYLRVLKTGAVRMDLTGNNAGFVTEEEAGHAKDQLETIRQQRLEKEKAARAKEEKKRLSNKLSQLVTKK